MELEELKTHFKRSRDHFSEWRIEAKEDFAFAAGDQWSMEDKALLEEQMRPTITFNRIAPVIDAVVGNEIQNRQEVRYIPRQIGDAGVNEVLSEAAKWFRDQSQAEDEETDAFLDLVVCGIGWTNSILEYDDNPDGEPLVDRVDPLEMFPDPLSRKRNMSDARHIFRVKEIAFDEAKAMFPDAEDDDLHAAWASTLLDGPNKEPVIAEDMQYYRDKMEDRYPVGKREKVRIVEAQWWEKKDFFRVADPQTGQIQELTPEDHKTLQERAKLIGIPIKSVKQQKKVYKRAFLGMTILEEGDLKANSFTYKSMTGKRDRNKGTFYGLVRQMKDPQRWANKWLSQTLHIMNSNSKGGLLAERDAFDNVRKAEDDWANPSAITWMKPGGLGKVKEKDIAQFPAGFYNITEFAISSIRDSTGVNMEILGLKNTNQPGILEQQRKQAGMTILATLFDSLRRYRKDQGKLMLYYITNYLSDGRLVRIVGEEGAKYIPLIHDPSVTEYDIIVDDSPTSPNQKEQVFGALMQLFPVLAKMPVGPDIWAELVKYSPLPESLTSKLSEQIQEQAKQPPPPDPAVQKMQAQLQFDQQKHQQDMQFDQQKSQADMLMEQQKYALDMQMHEQEHQQGLRQNQIEAQTNQDIEWRKTLMDALVKIEIAKMNAQLSAETSMLEMKLQQMLGLQEMHLSTAADIEKAKIAAKNKPKPMTQ